MRNKILDLVESKNLRTDHPDFRPGDTVRVHWKIREASSPAPATTTARPSRSAR